MRTTSIKPCAVALFLLASQSGCARVYEPAASPRIAVRGDGTLVKDGKPSRSLEEAVRGSPAAEAEARLAKRDGQTGGILMLGGPVLTLGTLITAYSLSDVQNAAGQRTLSPASAAVLIAGAVVGFGTMVVGAALASNADRHGRNAINLYNDGMTPSLPTTPAPR